MVNDVRQGAPDQPPLPEFYLSYRLLAGQEMSLVVRTAGDPDALADRVVRSIRSVDPTQPVFGVKSMTRLLANAEAERRFSLLLLSLFAAIALLRATPHPSEDDVRRGMSGNLCRCGTYPKILRALHAVGKADGPNG